jgi:DNA (cytosine-5)-methyltransferase 1
MDLFSGSGGLTQGLHRAGFRVAGAIEMDDLAVETYLDNHPEVHVWPTDITKVTGATVKRELGLSKGDLDLLAGCPPCQGFSTMRNLNGTRRVRDDRNDLVFEFFRFVDELRPRMIMLENVPGLAEDRRFKILLRQLRELKYHLDYRILDAADFGVPQRRKRLILLGSRNSPVELASPARAKRTVRDAIGGLKPAGTSGDALHDHGEHRSRAINQLIKRVPRDGGSRAAAGRTHRLACHISCDGFKDVYGRMSWDAVAPTITTGCVNPSKGRFLHPTEDRAITLREAALLQSFPRRYKFSLRRGKFAAAVMIGNALPPEFVRRQAAVLHRHLESA